MYNNFHFAQKSFAITKRVIMLILKLSLKFSNKKKGATKYVALYCKFLFNLYLKFTKPIKINYNQFNFDYFIMIMNFKLPVFRRTIKAIEVHNNVKKNRKNQTCIKVRKKSLNMSKTKNDNYVNQYKLFVYISIVIYLPYRIVSGRGPWEVQNGLKPSFQPACDYKNSCSESKKEEDETKKKEKQIDEISFNTINIIFIEKLYYIKFSKIKK
ncbi:hypothetical protein BpHYR1_048657 [Brachionus plicatilis]|uniref:Uncharacterized protein n=1 Tax=Brachionus plicatilis TaxID=10195 RepID=A0A3M7RPL7_BRAPC|nr:hypothetical protein BpHYR1_048657 [Brachionus plicatilis]